MAADTVDTNLVAVDKNTVGDYDTFLKLLDVYNIYIFRIEKYHYILDGNVKDLQEFSKFWNS